MNQNVFITNTSVEDIKEENVENNNKDNNSSREKL
jgi:hypothetical protein